ncbi:MAG: biotin transporter BioY [Tissierellaceae bacterium]
MKVTAKEISYVSMFTGLTAIGAFVSIPLGEVPISLQTLFVLLSGLVLGPRLGFLSQLAYLLLGLVGLPIFTGFTGGPQAILRPSFGFIIGFMVAALIVGKISHLNGRIDPARIWISSIVGTVIIYLFGLPYMYYILNTMMARGLSFGAVFKMACLLFLPGDIVKLIIASLVAIRFIPIIDKSGGLGRT